MKAVRIAVGVAFLMAMGSAAHADTFFTGGAAAAGLNSYNAIFCVNHSISEGFAVKDALAPRDWQPVSERHRVRLTSVDLASASMGGYCNAPTPTPEPDTALLFGTGLLLLAGGGLARRRMRMQ